MDADMTNRIAQLKKASVHVAAMKTAEKNKALSNISRWLVDRSEEIFSANERDLKQAEIDGVPLPVFKRLKFDKRKLSEVIDGINALIELDDPVGRVILHTELDAGLTLKRITCPIGVIGVIFESRPDALVQISTLCLKSGNAVIVKGGSEAKKTNRVLSEIIRTAASAGNSMPENWLIPCETRSETSDLLKLDKYIDLLIPRGSNEFIRYIMDNTRIPVMGHADGICHCFLDVSADREMAVKVVVDSKTQYAAVCNALETLLVHEGAAERLLPDIAVALAAKGVEMRCCERSLEILSGVPSVVPANSNDWQAEYLDDILSVKVVGGIGEAIEHINAYGSHHTDCIVTEDADNAEKFMMLVDSANVFHNCSTRFSDGFRYGFGAEVGISTGKLHARGPVGLDGLVSYKYLLQGDGHIVSDYSEKNKSFTHKKLTI
jgi:glutamate-5-semialdehyde dehydrogenase